MREYTSSPKFCRLSCTYELNPHIVLCWWQQKEDESQYSGLEAEKLPGSSGTTGVLKMNCIGLLMFALTRIPAEREHKMPQKISLVFVELP